MRRGRITGCRKVLSSILFILLLTLLNALGSIDTAAAAQKVAKGAGGEERAVVNPAWKREGGRVAGPLTGKAPFAANELLVKFKEGATEEKKSQLHKKHGAKKLREFKRLRLHRLKLKDGDMVEEAVARYKADPSVEYAEPNYLLFPSATPNDLSFSQLWGMARINAPLAWDRSTGSREVVVAVIDTGIDYNHPDLAANLWTNPGEIPGNGIDDDNDGYVDDVHGINAYLNSGDPMDLNGHGTHVAGTIGAVGNNALGVAGVNWSVSIMSCSFLNASGSGYTADAIDCLEYVKQQKDRGVNIVATSNSWGGSGYSEALYDAIKAQEEILFIAAAGNSSKNTDASPHYPSAYDLPNIISVAAIDSTDNLASFSNYGLKSVDIGAPGVNILSTLPAGNSWSLQGGYGSLSGTSMATPHVSGLAALLKAQDPTRDWQRIKNLLFVGGQPMAALAGKTATGKRIDALGSLSCQNRYSFSVTSLPEVVLVGRAYPLTVTSINCDKGVGPVTVSGDGAPFTLTETGSGNFTAMWTPTQLPVTLTFSSPAGSKSVTVSGMRVVPYLPSALTEVPYAQRLMAYGGVPPYQWTIKSGTQEEKSSNLPAGLSWDASGLVSGVVPYSSAYTTLLGGDANVAQSFFLAEVTDSLGSKASGWVSMMADSKGWAEEKWARLLDLGDDDRAWGTALDQSGNSYLAGQSHNGIDKDVLLAKYDPAGNLLWKRVYDGGGDQVGRSLAVDRNGNAYVAGVSGTLGDHLLLKYDPSGTLLWEKTWDAGGKDGALGVATDAAGYVYTVGSIADAGGERVVLNKFDPQGQPVWSKEHQESVDAYGYSIAVDAAGNVYFGGAIYSSATGSDMLVAKYDSGGKFLWSKTLVDTPSGTSSFSGVAVDSAGNLYATGWVAISDWPWAYGLTARYDSSGNLVWKSTLYGRDLYNHNYYENYAQAIAVTEDAVFIVCEDYNDWDANFLLVKYDKAGNRLWSKRLDVNGADDYSFGVAADASGVTVAGYTTAAGSTSGDVVLARFADVPAYNDLSLSDLTATWSDGKLSYNCKVKNSGPGVFAEAGIYLSADAVASKDDSLITSQQYLMATAARDATVAGSIPIPEWILSGYYYLTVVADHRNSLNEVSKSNNAIVGARYLLQSDLVVTKAAATVDNGSLFYFITVKNAGPVTAAASTTAVSLSTQAVASAAGYLVARAATPKLAPGAETIVTGTVPVAASIPPGTYYVAAMADADNQVAEADKANNGTVGNFVNLPVDFTLPSLYGSLSGNTLSYTVSVRNGSLQDASTTVGLYLSPDTAASTDDRLIGTLVTGTIPRLSDRYLSGTLTIPSDVAGSYYFAALADPANAVAETVETNNGAVASRFTFGAYRPSIGYTPQGSGSGTISFLPGGNCAGSCSQPYQSGTSVTMTATAGADSFFTGWGGACSGTGACTILVNSDQAVSANFQKKPSVSFAALGTGTGSVTFLPGTKCEGLCTQSYDAGSSVTITAQPGIGSRFTGWGGACAGSGSCTVTVSGDLTVYATFERLIPTVSAGRWHTLALTGGTAWGWGTNSEGELGDGTSIDRRSPLQLPAASGVVSLSAGSTGFASDGVRPDGTLWSWGDNYKGELGDGSATNRLLPVKVNGLSDVTQVARGWYFAAALKKDGTVWSWGANNFGQLGDGTNSNTQFRNAPMQVPGLSGIVALSAGAEHVFALAADGTLWAWGRNDGGQTGVDLPTSVKSPQRVPGISGVVAIAGGEWHTVALKNDGTVWTWGSNFYGELGDGSTATMRTAPAQVPNLSGVVSIAAGAHHVLALKGDGSVWAWGNNTYWQLGYGTSGKTASRSPITGVVAIAAGGDYSVAVKGDGSIWTWGDNRYGQLGDGTVASRYGDPYKVTLDITAPVTTPSLGSGTYDAPLTLTLTANEPATVYYTLDGSTPTTNSAVYAGPLSISTTTTVTFFARDTAGNTEPVTSRSYMFTSVQQPNAEFSSSATYGDAPLAVAFTDLSTGSLSSWSWNFGDGSTSNARQPSHSYAVPGTYTVSLTVSGPEGSSTKTKSHHVVVLDPAVPRRPSSIGGGQDHSAQVVNGSLWIWGRNDYGQLGDGGLSSRSAPYNLTGLAPVAAVSSGQAMHTVALHVDGTVSAWGRNLVGEVGDGTKIQRTSPVKVAGLTDVIAVSAGSSRSVALKRDGTVWSWGNNGYGSIGDGTTAERLTPVQATGLGGVTAIASGGYHTLALALDGSVWSWGYNYYGQLGDGSTANRTTAWRIAGLTDVVAVSAGTYHSMALKRDGTVWTWGGNWKGQIGDGTTGNRLAPYQVPGLSGVVAIAAGGSHCVAVKADGTVVAWGDNYYGQLGDGSKIDRYTPVPVPGLSRIVAAAAGSHTMALDADGTVWTWGSGYSGQLGDGTTTSRTTPAPLTAIKPVTVPPTTTASPAGGAYSSAQSVTLTSNLPAVIYYTTDGSLPTTVSRVYNGPIGVSSPTTLRYFARDVAGRTEAVNTQSYLVIPADGLRADFAASATMGVAPVQVKFSDLSTGAPTSWLWNFGDGATSTLQNPAHTYLAPGNYTVSLTVGGGGKSNIRMRTKYIAGLGSCPFFLQPVYDSAADGALIRLQAGPLIENPHFDRDIAVLIGGGYDFSLLDIIGATTIHGAVRVSRGKVSFGNVVIR